MKRSKKTKKDKNFKPTKRKEMQSLCSLNVSKLKVKERYNKGKDESCKSKYTLRTKSKQGERSWQERLQKRICLDWEIKSLTNSKKQGIYAPKLKRI